MLKKAIKRVVGQERITLFKQSMRFVKDVGYLRNHKRIVCDEAGVLYKKFAQKDKHVFFGYYDIQQLDAREEKLLVHVVDRKADAKSSSAVLGYYNVMDGSFVPFSKTGAWCWQQGARLRWYPQSENMVMYNDIADGHYVARIFNIETGSVEATVCAALYDVDSTGSFGLSLNFSRLQRLRPGYGYGALPDATKETAVPEQDGIFYVDIKRNTKKLIISLAELARQVDDPNADQHYINHISISPDGSKFMFFHIWTLKGDTHWKTRLCVYTFADGRLSVLEDKDRVSHYDWKSNDGLLVTCWDQNKKQYYCEYDLQTREKKIISDEKLIHDGHPTYLSGGDTFISDTYPLAHDMQTLFEYDKLRNQYNPIVELYSDARLYDEKRCDLHPRLSTSEKYISIDTTFEHGVKEVLLFNNWRKENG